MKVLSSFGDPWGGPRWLAYTARAARMRRPVRAGSLEVVFEGAGVSGTVNVGVLIAIGGYSHIRRWPVVPAGYADGRLDCTIDGVGADQITAAD
jgi:hypothetical protein